MMGLGRNANTPSTSGLSCVSAVSAAATGRSMPRQAKPANTVSTTLCVNHPMDKPAPCLLWVSRLFAEAVPSARVRLFRRVLNAEC